MTRTIVAAVCCDREATEPEGVGGHPHAVDCGGYDPRPRHRCCGARRGDGHRTSCRAYQLGEHNPGDNPTNG